MTRTHVDGSEDEIMTTITIAHAFMTTTNTYGNIVRNEILICIIDDGSVGPIIAN